MQVTEALQGLLATMTGAETGERGYLLTDNETYLALYTNARAEVAGEIVNLRRLTAGNYAQQQRIDTLEQRSTSKIDSMTQTIALRRNDNAAGALAIMRASGTSYPACCRRSSGPDARCRCGRRRTRRHSSPVPSTLLRPAIICWWSRGHISRYRSTPPCTSRARRSTCCSNRTPMCTGSGCWALS